MMAYSKRSVVEPVPDWAENTSRVLFPCQKRPKNRDLTRDKKLEIRALYHRAGWTQKKIAEAVSASRHQVRYALHSPPTPQKKRRHHNVQVINDTGKEAIQRWLGSDEHNRRVPWSDLPFYIPEITNVGETTVTKTMHEMGYSRQRARA